MFQQHSVEAGLQGAHQAFFSYVVPAVVALIGPGLTAVAKMSLDSSRTRRSDKLTERITKLCSQIHALPEFTAEDCTGCSPRQALVAQMNVAIQELSELQKKKHASIRVASVTMATRVRSICCCSGRTDCGLGWCIFCSGATRLRTCW